MTLNQFTLFAAVAKHLNVRKASEELRVSQPSVSQQLKQLEDRYGLKLYRRLSKGSRSPSRGRRFCAISRRFLSKWQVWKTASIASGHGQRETLRTGGTFTTCTILLPVLLARLQQLHPQAELECRTRSSEQLERLVIKSAMDVAVLARPSTARELAIERLRLEKVVVFVPVDHPLAQEKNLKLQDLVGETFIIRGGSGIAGTTEKALKRLQERGLGIKIGCAAKIRWPSRLRCAREWAWAWVSRIRLGRKLMPAK